MNCVRNSGRIIVERLDNVNVIGTHLLESPAVLKQKLPVSEAAGRTVARGRESVHQYLNPLRNPALQAGTPPIFPSTAEGYATSVEAYALKPEFTHLFTQGRFGSADCRGKEFQHCIIIVQNQILLIDSHIVKVVVLCHHPSFMRFILNTTV